MLILQQHLTLVTTINTQGGEKKKKKAIDRSAWLLLLQCFPGRLSSCSSQAGTDPRGCLQSSTRGGRAEQGDRELNAAVKWLWLPARSQKRRPRAKGCRAQLMLSSSLCHPQALGTLLWGGQDTSSREQQQFCGNYILFLSQNWPSNYDATRPSCFIKWQKKVHCGNKATFVLHQHCSKSLIPLPESTESLLKHWTPPKYHELHAMVQYSYIFSTTVTFITTPEKE